LFLDPRLKGVLVANEPAKVVVVMVKLRSAKAALANSKLIPRFI
jgi:hypothetical protein